MKILIGSKSKGTQTEHDDTATKSGANDKNQILRLKSFICGTGGGILYRGSHQWSYYNHPMRFDLRNNYYLVLCLFSFTLNKRIKFIRSPIFLPSPSVFYQLVQIPSRYRLTKFCSFLYGKMWPISFSIRLEHNKFCFFILNVPKILPNRRRVSFYPAGI